MCHSLGFDGCWIWNSFKDDGDSKYADDDDEGDYNDGDNNKNNQKYDH